MAFESEETLLSKQEYQGEGYEQPQPRLSFWRRQNYVHTIVCLLAGSALSFLLLGATSKVLYQPVSLDSENGLEMLRPADAVLENAYWCGHTPQEARAKGCVFDVVLYSWLAEPCFDAEMQEEFMERKENKWFAHPGEVRDAVPIETVMAGETTLWWDWATHVHHCKYVFKKMTRILQNRQLGIPGGLMLDWHTQHCLNILTGDDYRPADEVVVVVTANFSSCYNRMSPGLETF